MPEATMHSATCECGREVAIQCSSPSHGPGSLPKVQHILSDMRAHPRDVTIQKRGCLAIGQYAAHDVLDALLASEELVSCVLDAMVTLSGDLDLVIAAINTLGLLAAASEGTALLIVRLGGVNTLLRCVERHRKQAVFQRACAALGHISVVGDTSSELLHSGVAKHVRDVMRDYPDCATLLRSCCQILANLCVSGPSCVAVLETDVLTLLARCTEDLNHPNLVESACRALGALASYDESLDSVVSSGATQRMVAVMRAHPDDVTILQAACWTLACLTRSEESCDVMEELEGVDPVLDAMTVLERQTETQEYGCWTLSNLAAQECSRAGVCSRRVGERLLAALETCWDLPATVCHVLFTLAQLVLDDQHAELAAELTSLGVLGKVAGVMASLRDNAEVQVHGCRALCNISILTDCSEEVLAESGVEAAVASAMLTQEGNELIQQYGCQALANILTDDLGSAGCMEALINALRNHATSATIQPLALTALVSVTRSDTACQALVKLSGHADVIWLLQRSTTTESTATDCCVVLSRLAEAKGIPEPAHTAISDAVVMVMERYLGNVVIQLHACLLLQGLLLTGQGKRLFRKKDGLKLVMSITSKFPESVDIQECGCNTIALVAMDNELISGAQANGSAIRPLVTAMKIHPTALHLQLVACGALSQLSKTSETWRKEALSLDAVSRVLAAMATHKNEPRLQADALSTLGKLLRPDCTNNASLLDDVTQAVLDVMRMFPRDPHVQMGACQALMPLAATDRGKKCLLGHGLEEVASVVSTDGAPPRLLAEINKLRSVMAVSPNKVRCICS